MSSEIEDRKRLANALIAIYDMHNKALSDMVVNIWWHVAQQHGVNETCKALFDFLMSDRGKYLPKPADVIEFLGGSTEDKALIGWSKLTNTLRKYGTHRSICFDDPIITQVVKDMDGWIRLGQATDKDLTFKQADFIRRYKSYANSPAIAPKGGYLVGRSEDIDIRQGFKPEPPVMIGNTEQAKLNYKVRPSLVVDIKKLVEGAAA